MPMITAHGCWKTRSSILVRLRDGSGRDGYGEMAPVDAFGGPSAFDCVRLCKDIGGMLERGVLLSRSMPDCARFAFGSALAMLEGRLPRRGLWSLAALLPPGPRSLFEVGKGIRNGGRCFKYKLRGVPDATEREIIEMLFETLYAAGGRLRIDANESLAPDNARECLHWLGRVGGKALDFVEQPLPRGSEDEMRSLMGETGVPIALDESAAGMDAITKWIEWLGPLVVKPALAGDPLTLAHLLESRTGRTIFSSALESPIGIWGCLMAIGQRTPEPLGFGSGVWPEGDSWSAFTEGASMDSASITPDDMEAVWNSAGN